MKTKYMFRHGLIALLALAAVSCDKDGDTLTINSSGEVSIDSSSTEIVLDYNNIDALVLTLNWDENGNLTLSNPAVALPDGLLTNYVQLSLSDDFAQAVEVAAAEGVYSYQFTVGSLNSVMSRLGVEGGERAEVFVRIKSVVGKNIDPTYSNVISLFVTPYKIDMSVAYVLDKNQAETTMTLSSPESNGIYTGFVGVASWENWYLKEATGVIWGNSSTAGTFAISSSAMGSDFWNLWYPGIAGCYFTTVNTVDLYWSALSIPELTVAGDISGTMTFDRKTCVWTLAFDATPGVKNITISGIGTLYDLSTGDSSSSITKNVSLVGSSDDLRYSESVSSVSVNVTATGSQVMKLELVNPLQWQITFDGASDEPEEPVSPILYISGHDDAVSGSWHFNNFLRLYNEEDLAYAGGCYIDSKWGYKLYKESGNWDDAWGAGDGADTMGGSLVFQSSNNIPAPEAGLYVINARLVDMTYALTAVESVSYSGLNDDWSVTPMTATKTSGVYTAVVNKTAETPWGVKVLINESWDVCFGGGSGELHYGWNGFDGDNDLANGSYLLTVDLINGTYSYSDL